MSELAQLTRIGRLGYCGTKCFFFFSSQEAFSSDHASQQGFPGDFLTLDDDMVCLFSLEITRFMVRF